VDGRDKPGHDEFLSLRYFNENRAFPISAS
jgi:hypothetical protein